MWHVLHICLMCVRHAESCQGTAMSLRRYRELGRTICQSGRAGGEEDHESRGGSCHDWVSPQLQQQRAA